MWKNTANALSLSRIPLGILLILFYEAGDALSYIVSLIIIILAGLSDYLDGKIARATLTASKTGYFIDGLGDKAFYIAFYLIILRTLPSTDILCWLLIIRELLLYGLRSLVDDLSTQLQSLRKYSLYHAYFIRGWFCIFLLDEGFKLFGLAQEWLIFVGLGAAWLACIFAYYGLFLQVRLFLKN